MRILLGLLLLLATPALAQEDVAAFYRGKTVRIVVGVAVGSGYDLNARLLARHIGAHIPGTAIGAPFNGLPTTPLLQPGGARFDPNNLIWLGSTNRETQVTYVWHTAPVQSVQELTQRELIVGAQSPGSTQYDFAVLGNRLFGFKFKVITGYEATPKIHLAMESGEVHGIAATNWSTLKAIIPQWLAEKKVKLLAQWGLQKHPDLPDTPSILDMAKTEADRQALQLSLARLEYGRPFFLPPNVPPERVQALRRAFDATMKDPAYLAEAERSKIDIDPLSGAQVSALVAQVSRTPADVVARVRAAMENK
jgi:tripartite-type tricarboxylate transporter receptor subunit TctC